MPNTPITIVGNLVEDPTLRFIPSGAAVANFRVASTPRFFHKGRNEWADGETLFLSCSVWRQQAENAAETLRRGMRVMVTGRLKARTYETTAGERRTVFEVEVDEVAPTLRTATAAVSSTRNGHTPPGGDGHAAGRSRSRHDDRADLDADRGDDPRNPWITTRARPDHDPRDPWRSTQADFSQPSDEPPF